MTKVLSVVAAILLVATLLAAQNTTQPDSITVSQVLDVLNEEIAIPLDGKSSAAFQVDSVSSALMMISAVVSGNNGAFYPAQVRFIQPNGELFDTITNPTAAALYGIVIPAGATHVKVYVSSYTSGSVTGSLAASAVSATVPLISNGLTIPTNFGFQLLGGRDPIGGTARWFAATTNGGLHVNLRDTAGLEIGTAGVPVRVDPTGATAQPVTGPLTDAQLRATPVPVAQYSTTLAGYIVSTSNAAITATGDVLSLEAEPGRGFRIARLCIHPGSATAAAIVQWQLIRTTTASSGGTVISQEVTSGNNSLAKMDPADSNWGGVARAAGATEGTSGAIIANGMVHKAVTATPPSTFPESCNEFGLNGMKMPTVASGVTNGVKIMYEGTAGGVDFGVRMWFIEVPD